MKNAPDLPNILPSVRARGVQVPLIERANGSPGHEFVISSSGEPDIEITVHRARPRSDAVI